MPAATNQAELISVTEREFEKLSKLIADVDSSLTLIEDGDGISLRDILVHRATWIHMYLSWVEDGWAGRAVHMPAKGFGWGDLPALNAKIRETNGDVSWTSAVAGLGIAHDRLMTHISACDDDVLYGGPMIGGNGRWTSGRYCESAGASHYRSAAKYIRARLRAGFQR